jgi:hypothetical protein
MVPFVEHTFVERQQCVPSVALCFAQAIKGRSLCCTMLCLSNNSMFLLFPHALPERQLDITFFAHCIDSKIVLTAETAEQVYGQQKPAAAQIVNRQRMTPCSFSRRQSAEIPVLAPARAPPQMEFDL